MRYITHTINTRRLIEALCQFKNKLYGSPSMKLAQMIDDVILHHRSESLLILIEKMIAINPSLLFSNL